MGQPREIAAFRPDTVVAYRPSFVLRRMLARIRPDEIVAETLSRFVERSA